LIKEKIASHVNCRRNYSEQAQSWNLGFWLTESHRASEYDHC
jgi:hypothetical protein